jgi:hypothetical protein
MIQIPIQMQMYTDQGPRERDLMMGLRSLVHRTDVERAYSNGRLPPFRRR